MGAEVFISFDHQEQALAERLAADLRKAGWSVWWDQQIRSGARYRKAIVDALADARVVVVIWSAASVEADWVLSEATRALDAETLLPGRIDGSSLPPPFDQFQTLDISAWARSGETDDLMSLFTEIRTRVVRSDYEKHFILTKAHDTEVSEVRSDWTINQGRFEVVVRHDTGTPREPGIHARFSPPQALELRQDGFIRSGGERHAWTFGFTVPLTGSLVAERIESSYLWHGAAVLTLGDLASIESSAISFHRGGGRDFVSADVDRPLRKLTISVSFPHGFLPANSTVTVYRHPLGSTGANTLELPALAAGVHIAGLTMFLTLSYPEPGFTYELVWTPPPGRARPGRHILH